VKDFASGGYYTDEVAMTVRRPPSLHVCHDCSRRELLLGLGIAAVGTVLLSSCADPGSNLTQATVTTCGTGHCIDLNDPTNADLAEPGGAMLLHVGNDTVMVIRNTTTEVIALSAICTHSGCSMNYLPQDELLDCPCHGSQFATDGSVVHGPARKALRLYSATLANNVITVS
jgi:Rieske Fe-S protein